MHGRRVAYTQPGQQGFWGVDAACDVAACQGQVLRGQGLKLGVQALRHHSFNHQTLRQRRGVIGQGRHGHGSDAETSHQHHCASDQTLAVVVGKLLQTLRSEINLNLQEDRRLW